MENPPASRREVSVKGHRVFMLPVVLVLLLGLVLLCAGFALEEM
ncbi:hypothetical protein ABZ773_21435 [Streptomyces sp. NPDC047804]|nr:MULTISPECIES: hypothetical protein [Streptomyces]AGJ53305.1 hypothetical protein F750_0794 [Streptomyces sp. PAMC 26508]MDX2619967.1 hypothetical protein [Streptomyces sp. WI03-5b]